MVRDDPARLGQLHCIPLSVIDRTNPVYNVMCTVSSIRGTQGNNINADVDNMIIINYLMWHVFAGSEFMSTASNSGRPHTSRQRFDAKDLLRRSLGKFYMVFRG